MPLHQLKTAKILLSIFVPGGSLAFSGYAFKCFLVPIIGLFWTFTISLPRWIVTVEGFLIFMSGLTLIHIASFIYGAYLIGNNNISKKNPKRYTLILFFAVILLNLTILVTSHLFKKSIYGFEFYHIPSVSMKPTLLSGDIIMVDTWPIAPESMTPGKVLVFKKSSRSVVMIKRIQKTRKSSNEIELYFEGDNRTRSVDSRKFGWVSAKYVIGEAEFILFSFKDNTRWFRPIVTNSSDAY